ncbi:hypothetical protein GQ600_13596 [Phytophthora cactorum]|nr:hypothetical protein GQ600_13596 [Phytophthora cactorum]
MDLHLKDVYVYVPMSSSYGVKVRALAANLVTLLPDAAPRKYRVRYYSSELGVHGDDYNSGIVFELFIRGERLRLLSRKDIQYRHYRYIFMCILISTV